MPSEEQQGERHLTRWLPDTLLDLPPLEPVTALRTPHRITYQSMPSSRHVLRTLLQGEAFTVRIELDSEGATLQHVPLRDVHEARLTPLRPLDWPHYYWIIDGLMDDLQECRHPADGMARGRKRLAVADEVFRNLRRGEECDPGDLESAWLKQRDHALVVTGQERDAVLTLQQYLTGLTAHLVQHASSRAFADWAEDLLQEAERTPTQVHLPTLQATDSHLVRRWLQHRLLGSPCLTSTSGIIAGWHLLLSCYVLAVWFSGLLVRAGYESETEEALFGSLWMLDQGLLNDEELVLDVLYNLDASEYTSPDLAAALTRAMQTVASLR
jgi:hypothetical protein